jgi:hypothetical protein
MMNRPLRNLGSLGLGLIAVGIQQTTGVGNVDHFRNQSDFGGHYIKVAAEVAVGGGVVATTMLNGKGEASISPVSPREWISG